MSVTVEGEGARRTRRAAGQSNHAQVTADIRSDLAHNRSSVLSPTVQREQLRGPARHIAVPILQQGDGLLQPIQSRFGLPSQALADREIAQVLRITPGRVQCPLVESLLGLLR